MRRLISILAATLTAAVLIWVLDLFRAIGLLIYVEQFLAAMLAIALPLVFLQFPATGGQERTAPVPWYDIVAAIVSFAAAAYTAAAFPHMSELVSDRPLHGTIVAGLMCLLLLEGLRRTSGKTLAIVALGFFALALVGHLLPATLQGRQMTAERLTYYVYWDASAIFGPAMKIVTTLVVCFVFFGNALFKSGGSIFFTDISLTLMGRYRGGPAKIAIMASSLFGTISGSVVANVVTTGVVTIPLMIKGGFERRLAAAVEAVASTGGQLMPPIMGVAAFLMAEFLQVPYSDVVIAALIPAILFYAALFIQADLVAVRNNISRVDESLIPKLSTVLREGWYFPIPFAALIYSLFWLNYEPELSALAASAVLVALVLVFGFRGRRPKLLDFYEMLRDTGISVLELFMIGAAAGVVISTLNYSGLGFALTLSLVHLAGNSLILLLIISGVACIVLGMGMPTVGVYILLATLVAPALIEMKIEPMAAHMFIMYYGMLSMITPPVAVGAFAAANIARADPMQTGFTAVTFGWTAFVIPFLFVFSGTLLMSGDPVWIAIDFVAALAGVWFISAAVMGYSVRHLEPLPRVAYGIAGFCLLLPLQTFGGGYWVNAAGAVLAIGILVRERAVMSYLAMITVYLKRKRTQDV